MTAEFGPRDVDLNWPERVAARSMRLLTGLLNRASDRLHLRYRHNTATLVLSGESEKAGQAYNRGLLVMLIAGLTTLLPLASVMAISDLATALGETATWILLVPTLLLSIFTVVNGIGAVTLSLKTDVIDHTTEPLPGELADIQDLYVMGEISQAELERQVAEVIDR